MDLGETAGLGGDERVEEGEGGRVVVMGDCVGSFSCGVEEEAEKEGEGGCVGLRELGRWGGV